MPQAFSTSMAGRSSRRAEFGGDGADVVAGGEEERLAGQRAGLLVEHGGQRRGAADGDVEAVDRGRRLVELPVEVVEPDDVDEPVPLAPAQHGQRDAALALLGHRDTEQERRGRARRRCCACLRCRPG